MLLNAINALLETQIHQFKCSLEVSNYQSDYAWIVSHEIICSNDFKLYHYTHCALLCFSYYDYLCGFVDVYIEKISS